MGFNRNLKAGLIMQALAAMMGMGQEVSNAQRQEVSQQFRSMKSGFTSSPKAKRARSRRRYQIAFESRRRNRRK
jgi:hypothetical protein